MLQNVENLFTKKRFVKGDMMAMYVEKELGFSNAKLFS